jgi:predicted nucleic acid-binding protein
MILLDTNVLSAMMQAAPDEIITRWLDQQPRESIWITTITVMEISAGLQGMPASKKRSELANALGKLLGEKIQGRIATFDIPAAEEAAEPMAQRKWRGRPVDSRDTMIAGIAQASRATLATRHTSHFSDQSVPVTNPWQ